MTAQTVTVTGTPQRYIVVPAVVPDVKILFSEWAGRVGRSASLMQAVPGKCIICGAPQGSCTGQEHYDMATKKVRKIVRKEDAIGPEVESIYEETSTDEETTEEGGSVEGTMTQAAPVDTSYLDGAPKDSIVVGPGQAVEVVGVNIGPEVVITKPVYRAHKPHHSRRWTYIQLCAVNQRVPSGHVRLKPMEEAPENKMQEPEEIK